MNPIIPPKDAEASKGTASSEPSRARPALVKPAPKPKPRRARLQVAKVDPWSVMKISFLLSVALGIITVIASVGLWTLIDVIGLSKDINSIFGDDGSTGIVSLGSVTSFATIVAVVNVVVISALSMVGALLYNLSSSLIGGIGMTLVDD